MTSKHRLSTLTFIHLTDTILTLMILYVHVFKIPNEICPFCYTNIKFSFDIGEHTEATKYMKEHELL